MNFFRKTWNSNPIFWTPKNLPCRVVKWLSRGFDPLKRRLVSRIFVVRESLVKLHMLCKLNFPSFLFYILSIQTFLILPREENVNLELFVVEWEQLRLNARNSQEFLGWKIDPQPVCCDQFCWDFYAKEGVLLERAEFLNNFFW